MERVFGKCFTYAVDCYEVWKDQRCIEQKDVDGEIIGITYGDEMFIANTGLNNAGLTRPFKISLKSNNSQILHGGRTNFINEDRIQYYNEDFNGGAEPYICHLFCKYGRISYVRFATAIKDSNLLLPMPDSVYEYYGDMIELGSLSENSISKVECLCKQMVETFSSTRFRISLHESINQDMVWNSMVESFKSELKSLFDNILRLNTSWEALVALYAKNLIRECFDKIGYVSYFTCNHICENVFKAATSIHKLYNIDGCYQLKFKVYYGLLIESNSYTEHYFSLI